MRLAAQPGIVGVVLTPPTPAEIDHARAEWAEQLDDLREAAGATLTADGARELLAWGIDSGAGTADVERLPVALWGVSYEAALLAVLRHAAGHQWTDAELHALLERVGCSDPQALLDDHADEIVSARHYARGRARDTLWRLLDDVDSKVRLSTAKEILRQYGGHTQRGYAADVQAELDRLDREPSHATH